MKLKATLTFCITLLIFALQPAQSQIENLSPLSIKEIMAKDFIGHSPERLQWSADSKKIFFNWNPENKKSSSTYQLDVKDLKPEGR